MCRKLISGGFVLASCVLVPVAPGASGETVPEGVAGDAPSPEEGPDRQPEEPQEQGDRPVSPEEQEGRPVPPEESLRFFLRDVEGRGGESVEVAFGVEASSPLSMVAWSFEFDPTVLELSMVSLDPVLERILERLPGDDHRFEWFVNNEEGWFQASLVTDFAARESFSIPAQTGLPVSRMSFRVKEGVAPGEYPLRFTRPDRASYASRFRDGDRPVFNAAREHGKPFHDEDRFRETSEPTTFEDGTLYVPIIGDIGIFVRGDANVDDQVDISDPLHILGYLFTDGEAPSCPAASDANEDRRIDISDPIVILDFLFVGESDWVPTTVYESNYSSGEDGESSACSL